MRQTPPSQRTFSARVGMATTLTVFGDLCDGDTRQPSHTGNRCFVGRTVSVLAQETRAGKTAPRATVKSSWSAGASFLAFSGSGSGFSASEIDQATGSGL